MDGNSYNRGVRGHYWSSSANNTIYGWYFFFYNVDANVRNAERTNGFSIRCVAESLPVTATIFALLKELLLIFVIKNNKK